MSRLLLLFIISCYCAACHNNPANLQKASSKKLDKIIVSDTSFQSNDPYAIVYSNITVVNLLRSEGIHQEDIDQDAMRSYYVDYYLTQYNNGGFAQFVWNSKWDSYAASKIEEGLALMGSLQHLAHFKTQSEKVNALSREELQAFLEGSYSEEHTTREKLQNRAFYDMEEDLITLNANWLKKHPRLQVLSIENMYLELEKFLGRKIQQ